MPDMSWPNTDRSADQGHHPTQPCCLKSRHDCKSDIWVTAAILEDSGMAAREETTDLWFWPNPFCNLDISASHGPFSRPGPEGPPWMLDYVLIYFLRHLWSNKTHSNRKLNSCCSNDQTSHRMSHRVEFKAIWEFEIIHIKDF